MQLRYCRPEHRRFPQTLSRAQAEMRPGLARARQDIAPQGLECTLEQSAGRPGLPGCVPACQAAEVIASNRIRRESGPRQGHPPERTILGRTGDPRRFQPNLHSIRMARFPVEFTGITTPIGSSTSESEARKRSDQDERFRQRHSGPIRKTLACQGNRMRLEGRP